MIFSMQYSLPKQTSCRYPPPNTFRIRRAFLIKSFVPSNQAAAGIPGFYSGKWYYCQNVSPLCLAFPFWTNAWIKRETSRCKRDYFFTDLFYFVYSSTSSNAAATMLVFSRHTRLVCAFMIIIGIDGFPLLTSCRQNLPRSPCNSFTDAPALNDTAASYWYTCAISSQITFIGVVSALI